MNLAPVFRQRFEDNNGAPLAGGLLYTYQAGTTTPLATYSNSTGTTNTNPVVLDSSGYADVWLDPTLSYKAILKDAGGNQLWSVDNVNFPAGVTAWSANSTYQAGSVVVDAGGQGLLYASLVNNNRNHAVTDTTYWRALGSEVNVKSYGATGDGSTDDTSAILAALAACYAGGGGTVFFPVGTYKFTAPLDFYNYCTIVQTSGGSWGTLKCVSIRGAGRFSTTLLWAGGKNSDGKYGTAILARGKQTSSGGSVSISNYFGSISDIAITTNLTLGHEGGYTLDPDGGEPFTTIASTNGGVNISPAGGYAAYGTLPDRDGTSNALPCCAIYVSGEAPCAIRGVMISRFHFGIYVGVGYDTVIEGNYIQWNNVAICLRDAVTTTRITENILTNNAFGAYLYTSSQITFDGNGFEQNNAGADVLFGAWNSLIFFRHNYFEAGHKNFVFRGSSAGQFRTQNVYIEQNNGVSIDADLRYTGDLHIRDNMMDSTKPCAWMISDGVVDRVQVYVRNNFYTSAVATPYGSSPSNYPVPFTNWNLSQKYLRDESTMCLNDYDTRGNPANYATGRTNSMLAFATSTTSTNPIQIGFHNLTGAVAAKVTMVRAGATPKNVTFAEYLVGITRVTGAQAIASITALNNNTVAGQASGLDSTGALTVEVSGAVADDNFIQIYTSGTADSISSIVKVELYNATSVAWLVNTGADSIA